MGLFDKKYCDICGSKIGLLGNNKLSDGNMCDDCAKKLSPWMSGRKQMTLDSIRDHLAYREANEALVSSFNETRVLGSNWKVHFDDTQKLVLFSRSSKWRQENPDVFRFDQITGCTVNIDRLTHTHHVDQNAAPPPPPHGGAHPSAPNQSGHTFGSAGLHTVPGQQQIRPGQQRPGQQMRPAAQPIHITQNNGKGAPAPQTRAAGQQTSYETYSYNFNVVVSVNCDWFSEIRFRLNSSEVDESNPAQYNNMANEAESIRSALLSLAQANVDTIAAANAPQTAVLCPHCGATTLPDKNGCCEYCGGALDL